MIFLLNYIRKEGYKFCTKIEIKCVYILFDTKDRNILDRNICNNFRNRGWWKVLKLKMYLKFVFGFWTRWYVYVYHVFLWEMFTIVVKIRVFPTNDLCLLKNNIITDFSMNPHVMMQIGKYSRTQSSTVVLLAFL